MVQSLERQHASLKEDLARREDEIEDMKKKIVLRRGGACSFRVRLNPV